MRVFGAQVGLTLLAVFGSSACTGGPDADPADVIVIGHDMAPDPMADAEAGTPPPVDAEAGIPPPEDAEAGLDGPPPQPDGAVCPAPDGVIPGDLPLTDRAWRLDLPRAINPGRLEPGCGGGDTEGAEALVRFTPESNGEHLVIIAGRFSTLYHTPPCGPDVPPMIDACIVVGGPFASGATRARWLDLRAGEAIDLVADAPAGERAGPLAVLVYPPVPEGSSCAPIGATNTRPACRPGLVCHDDVCIYDGPPIPGEVRAWADGQSLRVEVEVAAEDVVEAIWGRVGDDDAGDFIQFQTTSVTIVRDRLILQGFVEDQALAAAPAVDIELIDAEGRVGRARSIRVVGLTPLSAGEPCDPDGMRDVCARGGACVLGQCRTATADAWATATGPNIRVDLRDAPAGPLLNAVVRNAPAGPADRWQPLMSRPTEVGRRWTGTGLDFDGPGLELRIQEPSRPPGLPVVLPLQPQPMREPGQPCDLEGVADRCPPTLACLAQPDEGRCVEVDPPVILSAQSWYGAESLGLKVAFRDPQDDAALIDYTVRDRRGNLRFALPAPLPLSVDVPGLYIKSFDAPWRPREGDLVEVVVIDAQGLRSDPVVAPLVPAPPVETGQICDPRGALSFCRDEDDICAAVGHAPAARCTPFEERCPEAWNPFLIEAPGRHDDNHFDGPDRTAGVCGGLGTPEAIYEVVARENARWRISVQPPGSTVYVRSHCAFAVAELAELACANAPFELAVRRGATYYIFVDGPAPGNPFTLQIE